ncbi:hypothetical protein [Taibaiella koreensis]|uniref:hypothetical protein n=1 Tax=Taibaiella koreensis TaxID=1268548 RepID=UPI001968B321|nr:hypothetical protein [Taibaiella koreensis]
MYHVEPFVSEYSYPANVLLSLWDAERQLVKQRHYRRLCISDEGTALCVSEYIDIGHSLYYIPVLPLCCLLKQNRKAGMLLVSVFSYLFREAGVCYYRDEGTYLYSEYDCVGMWLEEETYDDENLLQLEEFRKAEAIGDRMFKIILKKNNLSLFERRLKAFQPRNDWEIRCGKLAKDFLQLYAEFPEASIYSHVTIPSEEEYNGDYNDDHVMLPCHYLSFVADTKGCLWESVFSNVNNCLAEYSYIREPECHLLMDDSRKEIDDNITYEYRLLRLVGELITLLEELP